MPFLNSCFKYTTNYFVKANFYYDFFRSTLTFI